MHDSREKNDHALPPLRSDLEFHPGPCEPDGAPTYSVRDPLSGRYVKLGWAEATIMKCLRPGATLAGVVAEVNSTTTLNVSPDDVSTLCKDARRNGLLATLGSEVPIRAPNGGGPFKWLFANYLFFRIPLFAPDRFLERTLPLVRFLGAAPAFRFYLAASVVGILLLLGRLDDYFGTFARFLNWEGTFFFAAAVIAVKCIHELAHAYTAKSFGVRVPSIGVAFMFFWPILYTDVTDSWKLRRRADRLKIAMAGVTAEIVVAGLCTVLWIVFPDGRARNIFFVLSSSTWISSLLVNLNPAMRFDGYYMLSDLWGVDNLQQTAFAAARTRIRNYFWGIDAPDETGPPARRITRLVVYSLCTWTYRFFLYAGIAVFVYYKFTKVLGLTLFALELWRFILLPVRNELRYLWRARKFMRPNWRPVVLAAAGFCTLVWLAFPFGRTVSLPSVVQPRTVQTIYAPRSGVVSALAMSRGLPIEQGQLLVAVFSHELQAEYDQTAIDKKIVENEIGILSASEQGTTLLGKKNDELSRTNALLSALQAQKEQSHVYAALDGQIYEFDESIAVGAHVTKGATIGRAACLKRMKAVALMPEGMLATVKPGAAVTFTYGATPVSIGGKIAFIAPVRATRLDFPSLAIGLGGDVPTVNRPGKPPEIVGSYFLLEAELDSMPDDLPPKVGQSGSLRIESHGRSMLADFFSWLISTAIRESAF